MMKHELVLQLPRPFSEAELQQVQDKVHAILNDQIDAMDKPKEFVELEGRLDTIGRRNSELEMENEHLKERIEWGTAIREAQCRQIEALEGKVAKLDAVLDAVAQALLSRP